MGETFFDLSFLIKRANRGFTILTKEQYDEEWRLFHTVHAPYRGMLDSPAKPEPLKTFSAHQWILCCQESHCHLTLLRTGDTGEVIRKIQWEDDAYLVHIAEQYLLLLFYRLQPGKEYANWQDKPILATWGPEHFPGPGHAYLCPPWLERIMNQGYY